MPLPTSRSMHTIRLPRGMFFPTVEILQHRHRLKIISGVRTFARAAITFLSQRVAVSGGRTKRVRDIWARLNFCFGFGSPVSVFPRLFHYINTHIYIYTSTPFIVYSIKYIYIYAWNMEYIRPFSCQREVSFVLLI